MKKIGLLVMMLAGTMFAASPFVGTWKLDLAKSKYKVGTPPKEAMVVMAETGADLNVKVTGTPVQGPAYTFNYTVPTAGGTGKVIALSAAGAYDGVASKYIAPNEREITYLKAGKVVYTAHSKVSADGKSLTVSAKGKSAAGNDVEADVLYVKQ
jgi:hypothetical protein